VSIVQKSETKPGLPLVAQLLTWLVAAELALAIVMCVQVLGLLVRKHLGQWGTVPVQAGSVLLDLRLGRLKRLLLLIEHLLLRLVQKQLRPLGVLVGGLHLLRLVFRLLVSRLDD
jgi:hypothetical protein